MIESGLYWKCAQCRVCEGSGYQTVPLLGCGEMNAPILVIAQNPGEIKTDDAHRFFTGQALAELVERRAPDVENSISSWYQWDFGSSLGARRLGEIFGRRWLDSGLFYYTNAVRCRTISNRAPSDEMVENCRRFTMKLIEGRKAIIFVGRMAVAQLLGEEMNRLRRGELKQHPKYGLLLAVGHYAAWNTHEEIADYVAKANKIKRMVHKMLLKEAEGEIQSDETKEAV